MIARVNGTAFDREQAEEVLRFEDNKNKHKEEANKVFKSYMKHPKAVSYLLILSYVK